MLCSPVTVSLLTRMYELKDPFSPRYYQLCNLASYTHVRVESFAADGVPLYIMLASYTHVRVERKKRQVILQSVLLASYTHVRVERVSP